MDPFATSDDLMDRWPNFPDGQDSRADLLLADASMMIRSRRRDIDAAIVTDPVLAHEVKAVTCSMVKRAMQGPVDLEGVRQVQDTTGPFSQGLTFDNPNGELFLTKSEKARLGIGQQRAFNVDIIGVDEPASDESSSSDSSSS